jgi:hypothetical protein
VACHVNQDNVSGWSVLSIRIMCLSGASCLHTGCCYSELALYPDWHDPPLWHIFTVLTHCSNSLCEDTMLPSDTLSWLTGHSTLTHYPDWHDTPLWHIFTVLTHCSNSCVKTRCSTLTHYPDWHDTPLWHIFTVLTHCSNSCVKTRCSTQTHYPDWHDTPLWHIILIDMTLHSDTFLPC